MGQKDVCQGRAGASMDAVRTCKSPLLASSWAPKCKGMKERRKGINPPLSPHPPSLQLNSAYRLCSTVYRNCLVAAPRSFWHKMHPSLPRLPELSLSSPSLRDASSPCPAAASGCSFFLLRVLPVELMPSSTKPLRQHHRHFSRAAHVQRQSRCFQTRSELARSPCATAFLNFGNF